MAKFSHRFVETYDDMIGFGLDRAHDEAAVIIYLQMFSDDSLIKALVKRMTDEELEEVFELINRILRKHLVEPEYHTLFLKDEDHHH